jgi:hypothetical protein
MLKNQIMVFIYVDDLKNFLMRSLAHNRLITRKVYSWIVEDFLLL